VEYESLTTLKKQYVAAMSLEMKTPLQRLIQLSSKVGEVEPQAAGEIKDTARYLLSLVDELLEFTKIKP
jgi:signal transduction histidine kinase